MTRRFSYSVVPVTSFKVVQTEIHDYGTMGGTGGSARDVAISEDPAMAKQMAVGLAKWQLEKAESSDHPYDEIEEITVRSVGENTVWTKETGWRTYDTNIPKKDDVPF